MASIDFSPAITAIEQAKNILVLPSSPPDGDSLGSALAFYLALQKKGKNVTVVCADPVPDAYKFLPDSQSIEADYNLDHDFIVKVDVSQTGFKNLQYEVKDNKVNIIITPEHGEIKPEHLSIDQESSKFDLIITVDTAELKQLGKVYESNLDLFEKLTVLNIDHHPSNAQFGQINIVNPDKASTTLMLTELFQTYDMSLIDSDIATLLLAGLITDTGSFQNSNTTPEAFDAAALLIGLGARQQEIIRHIYKTKELHTLRLWGRVLSNIQTDYDHKMVWSTVSQADFKDTNSKESDIGDIIDELLSNAPEAEVVMLFKELSDGATHVSMRTTTDEVNASKIAQIFGGGGHRRAAGANILDQEFTQAVQMVLDYVKNEQAERLQAVAPAKAFALAETAPAVEAMPVAVAPAEAMPEPMPAVETVVEPVAETAPAVEAMPEPMPAVEPVVEPVVEPMPTVAYDLSVPAVVSAPAAEPEATDTAEIDQYLTKDEDNFMEDMNKFTPDQTTQTQGPDIDFSDYLRRH